MSTAGYSGTPLARKLGIAAGTVVVALGAPADLDELLAPLPDGVVVRGRLFTPADVVLIFLTEQAVLIRRLAALRRAIEPHGMIWVCWPKRASRVPTDVTEDRIRDIVLPTGLVDVKVAAVDATWSGLKLVVRRELR